MVVHFSATQIPPFKKSEVSLSFDKRQREHLSSIEKKGRSIVLRPLIFMIIFCRIFC